MCDENEVKSNCRPTTIQFSLHCNLLRDMLRHTEPISLIYIELLNWCRYLKIRNIRENLHWTKCLTVFYKKPLDRVAFGHISLRGRRIAATRRQSESHTRDTALFYCIQLSTLRSEQSEWFQWCRPSHVAYSKGAQSGSWSSIDLNFNLGPSVILPWLPANRSPQRSLFHLIILITC